MRPATLLIVTVILFSLTGLGLTFRAEIVPNEIKQPGTQDDDGISLISPDTCDNCHGGYDSSVEPDFNWRGSLMANATRDPLFWASVAIAEQDFDGVGDMCIRCHSTTGWLEDRSTPTDGSGLDASDADGVDCAFCHRLCNPDDSEYLGTMNPPFEAHNGGNPPDGYYGSGMTSIWPSNARHGPYQNVDSQHGSFYSRFNRDVNFCGTCHDVSNPAVGDLAHNNGTLENADPVMASGVPGAPIEGKAAFNNFPYQYGILERTSSEFMSGKLSSTLVSSYASLPDALKQGVIQRAYEDAFVAGTGGNYEDGTDRYFSCQTCHMRPVTGKGATKNSAPVRYDLPLHDMTGGNTWTPEAIHYLDDQDKLLMGGGLSLLQKNAMDASADRALENLIQAAALEVAGNELKVINLTGHKLITGFPEGRRMWLNMKWYNSQAALLREDGAYGTVDVTLDNETIQVDTLIDLYDSNTRIYEAQPGMSQEWASQLLALGYPSDLPLGYDRITGNVDHTLGELAATPAGTAFKTFHFALNNTIVKDNRIPPFGMAFEKARKRNALPIPNEQYGNPNPQGEYDFWDTLTLNPPQGAVRAEIALLYQPTSWEYIQFLYLANDGSVSFLAEQGEYILEAWLNTDMAAPSVMAEVEWTGSDPNPNPVPMDPASRRSIKGMGAR